MAPVLELDDPESGAAEEDAMVAEEEDVPKAGATFLDNVDNGVSKDVVVPPFKTGVATTTDVSGVVVVGVLRTASAAPSVVVGRTVGTATVGGIVVAVVVGTTGVTGRFAAGVVVLGRGGGLTGLGVVTGPEVVTGVEGGVTLAVMLQVL